MAEKYRLKLKDKYIYEEGKVSEKELENIVNKIYDTLKKEPKPDKSTIGGTYYGSTQLLRHVDNRLDLVQYKNYSHTPKDYYDFRKDYEEAYYVIIGGAYDRNLYKKELERLKNSLTTKGNLIRIGDYLYGMISDYGTAYSVYGFYRVPVKDSDVEYSIWEKKTAILKSLEEKLPKVKSLDELEDLIYEAKHSDIEKSSLDTFLWKARPLYTTLSNISIGKTYKAKYSHIYPKYIEIKGICPTSTYLVDVIVKDLEDSVPKEDTYNAEKLIDKLKYGYH